MPHFWNNTNKIAVTVDELVPMFWNSKEYLSVFISRNKNKPYGVKALQKACRGRKLLIDFDSLPSEVQVLLGDPRKLEHNLQSYYITDSDAVNFYTMFRRLGGNSLLPIEQQRYITNASVMIAILKLKQRHIEEKIKLNTELNKKDIDWNNSIKKEIWKSIINNKLGKSIRFFARNFKIIDLTSHKEFVYKYLEDNHLQGSCGYTYAFGLYNNKNEVYSIITFGKSRFDKNIEYELLRFCNLKYHNVRGAASKLMSAFEKYYKPKSIVSYANRDWSMGNLYKAIGFTYIKSTNTNYYYFDNT